MAQEEGGLHTLHTFLGVAGACPGFSAQAKEGVEAFKAAVAHRFTEAMRLQVRFLWTDSPSELFLEPFPNAVGVAEDCSHLLFRLERRR